MMRLYIIIPLILPLSLILAQSDCEGIGGVCQDYLTNVCTAGYETGLCPGGSNIRCCKNCDSTCQSNENNWSQTDNCPNLSADNNVCMDNTNYCDGAYIVGQCNGPSTRQCCFRGCPRIVSREEWNARSPTSVSYISTPVQYQFVHHTEGSECNTQEDCSAVMRSIQDYHMDSNGRNDIGYSFLVGGDGNIYEGRGWGVQGSHTQGFNSQGYGTSFMGNFMIKVPSQEMIDVYHEYEVCATALGEVVSNYDLYGHRQTNGDGTDCPGDALYAEIQNWDHWRSGYIGKKMES